MQLTVNELKTIQASCFTYFLKAWFFHWNVEGREFIQLHELFGEIYNDLFGAIDDIAEIIRSCDKYAPGSYSRFMELSNVKEETKVPSADMMIQFLKSDNDIIIDDLRKGIDAATKENLQEVVNFLSARLEIHTKFAWKLRSILKQ
jgi:starvation-inducible DNA-binding protein